jgi:hypothetical protein
VKRHIALTLFALSSLVPFAWPQCNNPSSPGVVICTPTNGSTVSVGSDAGLEVSVRSTPAQGASITRFIIYDNNVNVYEGSPGQTGINVYNVVSGGGTQDLVVNAWDTDGHLYEAKSSIYVTGFIGTCSVPTSPEINFCQPTSGEVLPTLTPVGVAVTGATTITKVNFYINGALAETVTNGDPQGDSYGFLTTLQLPKQGVAYTVAAQAVDTKGTTYDSTKTITADYTYGAYSCAPKGNTCYPGINVIAPVNEAYVGNTFNLDAQILDNPKPITTMKAYIDDSVVATSSNSTLQHEISDAPSGTHILTIQGWDDDGTEYRIQENININVSE